MKSMRTAPQGTAELNKVEFSNQGDTPVDVSDVKLWMRREGVAVEIPQIKDLIDGVVDELIEITNASLISQTITATYTSFSRDIKLPYGPVNAITSVSTLYEGAETALTTDDYYLHGDTLIIKKLENKGLKVVYTSSGYFPAGLKTALLQSVLTTYNDREDNIMGGVVKIPTNSRAKALRFKRY